ncbi:glyoxylate/hydroxypyruvate reductase A [Pigmentiphaga aceris]|uniref:Glyoxylate/hydroxypyruvate reductase A n=1 Tax=Pigmentiphaga aceris TaxID=1940612 RepID=A0A5C0AWB6_9BURK|nr:glyoxylate/hydroxypyruvate reductase A [Pigmentiphaga aceris]QEI06679.1 glyoxylate/hydroxypyruvate reductase A [Pigmentiphaga aceris]
MSFLYKSEPARGAVWAKRFAEVAPDIPFHIWPETGDPLAVRYLAAWQPPEKLMETFPNLELVFCVAAGIDNFDLSGIPLSIPVVRMIEPGLAAGMTEYIMLTVLAAHRDWLQYIDQQRSQVWKDVPAQLASSRRVGILGMGALGKPAAQALANIGFQVAGWSRSGHDVDGIESFAGEEQLPAFLARCDILVCLLPLTDATRGILNRKLFDTLPKGAILINAGRGAHLVEDDLLSALDDGQLGGAILDVTLVEPLPADAPLWKHPRVLITPHVASRSQAETSIDVLMNNLQRFKRGEPMVGEIDRTLGY